MVVLVSPFVLAHGILPTCEERKSLAQDGFKGQGTITIASRWPTSYTCKRC
jgi:hypothetical protein